MQKLERIPWSELGPEFMELWGWPNGKRDPEHITVLGPTGSGKSVFSLQICQERAKLRGAHVIVIATKPADKSLISTRWPIVEKWPPQYGQDQCIFWPAAKMKPEERKPVQKQAIGYALNDLWRPNANHIVMFDEIAYLEQELGLRTTITTYWREARSVGITMVAGTQRPRGVSRYMHSESAWVAAFKPRDEDEALRMAEICGSRREFKDTILGLKRYEFLLVRRSTDEKYISKMGT